MPYIYCLHSCRLYSLLWQAMAICLLPGLYSVKTKMIPPDVQNVRGVAYRDMLQCNALPRVSDVSLSMFVACNDAHVHVHSAASNMFTRSSATLPCTLWTILILSQGKI